MILTATRARTADEILGTIDATNLRSSMTVFARAAGDGDGGDPLRWVRQQSFGGPIDEATEGLLGPEDGPARRP